MCTRVHSIDEPVSRLSRKGMTSSLSGRTTLWQFMQVLVGGMAAAAAISTVLWQYLQSIFSSPA
jgi:hypothetical protein